MTWARWRLSRRWPRCAPVPKPSGAALPLSAVKLDAPIPVPRRNIFCVGLNYRAHATEFANSGAGGPRTPQQVVPEFPVIFSKVPESVIAPEAAIRIPNASQRVDRLRSRAGGRHRQGRPRHPARRDAMDHVCGYTIVNDVTARDLQGRHQQWLLGKSLDTFCPMGPWARDRRRARRRATPACAAGSTASCARTRRPTRPDLRHPDPDLDHLGRHHALSGRRHRHRHARRASASASTRPSSCAAAIACASRLKASVRSATPSSRSLPMATQFVERIAVETDGSGDDVLLIHGLGGTSNVWMPLMPTLMRHRTVRPDLPGSGRSARVEGPLTIDRFVQAMLRVCARSACRARACGRPFDGHDRGVPSRRCGARSSCAAWRCSGRCCRRPTPRGPA